MDFKCSCAYYLAETLVAFPDGTRRLWAGQHGAAGQAETSLHIQPQVNFQEK